MIILIDSLPNKVAHMWLQVTSKRVEVTLSKSAAAAQEIGKQVYIPPKSFSVVND